MRRMPPILAVALAIAAISVPAKAGRNVMVASEDQQITAGETRVVDEIELLVPPGETFAVWQSRDVVVAKAGQNSFIVKTGGPPKTSSGQMNGGFFFRVVADDDFECTSYPNAAAIPSPDPSCNFSCNKCHCEECTSPEPLGGPVGSTVPPAPVVLRMGAALDD